MTTPNDGLYIFQVSGSSVRLECLRNKAYNLGLAPNWPRDRLKKELSFKWALGTRWRLSDLIFDKTVVDQVEHSEVDLGVIFLRKFMDSLLSGGYDSG